MKRLLAPLLAVWTLAVVPAIAQIVAVPNSMNFQGRLARPDGTPVADGNYSVRFRLYDALTGGTVKFEQTLPAVSVRSGAFAVTLSGFPAGTFNGSLWLGIRIGTAAELSPRQPLATVAYAFKADSVKDGAISAASLAPGAVTAPALAPGLLNPLAWLLGGNAGTSAANFLGTTDNRPLAFKANNRRAMRYEYGENTSVTAGNEYRSMNVLGGSEINAIGGGVVGATIAGGGVDYFTRSDLPNVVLADFGTIGGGGGNTAGNTFATVAGGSQNTASHSGSAVGGGFLNTAGWDYSTVGGGYSNRTGGIYATVAGGANNAANGDRSTIPGGQENAASANFSTVLGGFRNTASGTHSTAAGGWSNTAAGNLSFAAGRRAKANHDGSFVWGDNTDADFASSAANQFLIRAAGGVGVNTSNPAGNALNVAGSVQMTGFKLPTGASADAVLTSDAAGVGSWRSAAALFGTPSSASSYNVWGLTGNAGTSAASFLGTTDNQALRFRVNNRRVMRYEYAENTATAGSEYHSVNIVGGSENNSIGVGVVGATIAGGGRANFTGGGLPNQVQADFGTIGGGIANVASGNVSTIGGGSVNTASGTASTIAGGYANAASGYIATVGGGFANVASGDYSFAAGRQAHALHNGVFVWADNSAVVDFASTGANQFLIRAAGGIGVNTGSPLTILHVEGNADTNGTAIFHSPKGSNASHIHYGKTGDWYIRSAANDGNVILQDTGGRVGVGWSVPAYTLDVNGTIWCSGFINASDARWKKNVASLDNALEAVLNLRGVRYDWNRDAYPDHRFPEGRQIGFLAQEVEKVLPELVSTDVRGFKAVAYQNVVPVLVEAVKTQQKQVETLKTENADLKAALKALTQRIERLEKR